jgi:secreted trypsin-like serine protease
VIPLSGTHSIKIAYTYLRTKRLFVLLDFSKCGINIDTRRIAQSSAIGLWPWMGSLGSYEHGNWSHHCGASLIDDSRVITAAHCVLSEKKVIAE